ncbi:LAFA_0D06612g1_1 [Lachancea sp. 'fantastica']|nr:LAFA_0D06612g1_1 [Lachancea sp. 'fantastica']
MPDEKPQSIAFSDPVRRSMSGDHGLGAEQEHDKTAPIAAPSTANPNGVANTAFIQKLYNMLEDPAMRELIWWAPSETSFLIHPTERFSKALATYFKHANIASFVRQLNMYGFHKVNDHHRSNHQSARAKHESSPATTPSTNQMKASGVEADTFSDTQNSGPNIWEFRHSSAAFRRGDFESLKSIKRRSSRQHASNRKNSNSTISTPLDFTAAATEQWSEQLPGIHRSASTADVAHGYPFPATAMPSSTPNTTGLLYPSVDYFGPTQSQQHQQNYRMVPPASQAPQNGMIPQAQGLTSSQSHIQSQERPLIGNKVSDYAQSAISQLIRPEIVTQTQFEYAVDDLRNTNMDMVKLLDLVNNLVSSHHIIGNSENTKRATTPVSNRATASETGVSPGNSSAQQHNSENLMTEILKLRNSAVNRLQRSSGSQQSSGSVRSSVDYPPANSYNAHYPNRTNTGPNKSSFSSPALSQLGSSQPTPPAVSQLSQTAYQQTQYFPTSYSSTGGAPTDYFNSTSTKVNSSTGPYLMLNPFERKDSASLNKSRHMSVLMDPLAPAPMNASVAAVTNGAPLSLSQQHNYYMGHQVTGSIPLGSVGCSKNDVKSLPTSNPDGQDTKIVEKRPASPSIAEMPVHPLPVRGGVKQFNGGANNAMTYKPYFPYGTVPGTGRTSPLGTQVPQYTQMALPSHRSQQQAVARTHFVQRGPSPLNPHTAEAAEQESSEEASQKSNPTIDQELSTARRDDPTGSSSRVSALLNYDAKEQSSKKMRL